MDGAHETLDNSELVVDDLGQGGEAVGRAGCVRDLPVSESGTDAWHNSFGSLTTVYSDLYASKLTPTTNMGASAEGAEMMTFLAPPFKWADALSTVVKTP